MSSETTDERMARIKAAIASGEYVTPRRWQLACATMCLVELDCVVAPRCSQEN